jgi:alkanesulfonate monooxygenase SsuD/methylene tetrahydromethanopterin reductase-like flavin-dependent oxidoreductase (luciferase family)
MTVLAAHSTETTPGTRKMMERTISGGATFPVIGSYDEVAEKFLRLSQAGSDGMAIILVNYVNEMPVLRDEMLAQLERLKIREARKHWELRS